MRGRSARSWAKAAAASMLAVVLVGCGGSSDLGDAAGGDSEASDSQAGALEDSAEAPARAEGGSDTTDGAGRTAPQTKAMIFTAEVSLESKDLDGVRDELDRLLGRWGGYVADEKTFNDEDGRIESSTIQVRVPAQHFEELLSSFGDFATVKNARRHEEDVTTEVIDVDSRIRTQELSLRRLRGFLNRSTDVDSMIRLESEIAEREASLDSLRAQQKYLGDQVDLATVTVHMTVPDAGPPGEKDPLDDAGFLTGLRNGWNALGDIVIVAATVLGALTPFAVVLAIVGVPLGFWLRRRHRAGRGRAAPTPAP